MALIFIMGAVVVISIIIASIYYRSSNKSVDSRVVEARQLYSEYNNYARSGNYYRIFSLLDSVESIYASYLHYTDSYERGVILNNRAAALLTLALYRDSIRVDYNPYYNISIDSINKIAETNLVRAITIYSDWKNRFENRSAEEIEEMIKDDFLLDFNPLSADESARYLKSRAEEILKSISETDRRLSVCYTNLGVLSRQKGEYDLAVKYYREALALWDRNLSAENNLNAIFGNPPKRRNILQRLFPPDRKD
ncbi:MAG: hypothetical protein E4G95_00910 [Bacteroidia bacterium]|nr:MAG: hypothetical protein E4G95_00910 [Bacteroidia bacterium]